MITSIVTEDDIIMLKYFIGNKDVTSWCDWDKRKKALLDEIPILNDYITAKRMLSTIEAALLKTLDDMDTSYD